MQRRQGRRGDAGSVTTTPRPRRLLTYGRITAATLVAVALVAALAAGPLLRLRDERADLTAAKEQRDTAAEAVADLEHRITQLEDPRVAEIYARKQLGVVADDEELLVLPETQTASAPAAAEGR